MTLTKEQREVVETGGTVPMTIEGIECVVLRADVFQKVRTVLTDGLSHDELRAMLARSAHGSNWLDPAMDVYDEYDKHLDEPTATRGVPQRAACQPGRL